MKKEFLRLKEYAALFFAKRQFKQLNLLRISHYLLGSSMLILLFAACSKREQSKDLVFEQQEDHYAVSGKDYAITFNTESIDVQLPSGKAASSMSINASRSILANNQVIYKDVADQADLVFYDKGTGNAGYDIRLRPRGNLEDVQLELADDENAYLTNDGQLVIPLENGEIRHSQPYAYQEIDGKKIEVDSRFALAEGILSFEVGAYNRDYELVIDPEILFAATVQVEPTFLNIDTYSSAVSSVTVNMPDNSNIGDLILVYIVTDDDGTITEPAEFIELYDFFHDATGGPLTGLFYRFIDGTEAASYDFTFPAEPAVVTTLRYANVDQTTPFDAMANISGDSNAPQAPSVTTTKDGRTILQFIGVDGASGGVLTSNSVTSTVVATAESGTAGGNAEMIITSECQAMAGATPVGSFSFSVDEWTGITLALNAAGLSTNNTSGTSCAATSSFTVDYISNTTSGTFELVDPSGTVLTTTSYTGLTGTATLNFTTTTTGSYTVRDQANPTNTVSENFFIDTDGDSFCDDVDADDDNDGILDIVESPFCFDASTGYESGDRTSLITVTTTSSFNDGDPQQLVDGNKSTTGNGVRRTISDIDYGLGSGGILWQFQLSAPIQYTSFTLFTEGSVFLDSDMFGTIQGSNDGTNWTDLTPTNGLLMDDPNTVYEIPLSQNLAPYTFYRMFCTSGRVDEDEWLSEVEGTTERLEAAPLLPGICEADFDNDNLLNHLDVDSDGDGCFDALEGDQILTAVDANGRLTGGVDANGVPLVVSGGQKVGDSQNGGYFNLDCPCLDPNKFANNCDFDDDGIPNEIDIDDDNDGVPDIEECGNFVFSDMPGGSTSNTITVCYNEDTNGINGSNMTFTDNKLTNPDNFGPTGTYKATFNLVEIDPVDVTTANLVAQGCQIFHYGGDGTVREELPTNLTSDQLDALYEWSLLSPQNIVLGFQGLILRWSDHIAVDGTTNPTQATTTGRAIFGGPFGTVTGFNQAGTYRGTYQIGSDPFCPIMQDAVGGVVGLVDITSQDIFVGDYGLFSETGALTNNDGVSSNSDIMLANLYAFMAQYILEGQVDMCQYLEACTQDTDGDMVFDIFDLDSDGDGCSDLAESGAGAVTNQTVDADSPTPNVGNNGLANSLETMPDNGILNYTLQPYLTNSQVDACADNDGDGIGDIIDEDDDNDGILDEDECGDFDFIDAPGGATTNTVTVCYNQDVNGINGGNMTFTDNKLENPANFGPTGTYKVTFNLVEITPANITVSNLVNQGCQIFQFGLNGSDRDDLPSNVTNTQLNALYNWSLLSPQNVVFGFQGLIRQWSDHLPVNGTTNPTQATNTGRAIFTGPFGTVSGFNQAGTYQGIFQPGNDPFCSIMQDAVGGIVGLIDLATQDIFVADVGLFSETGALTSNNGISSTSDIMLANVYAFMAQYILEGETDMCVYLERCSLDTDMDLTVDAFDTDSDDDDCPDAVEGDGSITFANLDIDNRITGGISNTGIPLLAGSGQGIGTSIDANLLSPLCASDLKLEVDQASRSANSGEFVDFTFTLTNEGGTDVNDVQVQVNIPSNTDFVSAIASQGDYSNLTRIWDVGLVPVGTQTLTVSLKLK
ncbi:MAG: DUF11 domain-containing protein [Bacteroidota bacterium]